MNIFMSAQTKSHYYKQLAAIRFKKEEDTQGDEACCSSAKVNRDAAAATGFVGGSANSCYKSTRTYYCFGSAGGQEQTQQQQQQQQQKATTAAKKWSPGKSSTQQQQQQAKGSHSASTDRSKSKLGANPFANAQPITGGIGRQLLEKMGWQSGQGLGRHNEGSTEPVAVQYKTDRKGLACPEEKSAQSKPTIRHKATNSSHVSQCRQPQRPASNRRQYQQPIGQQPIPNSTNSQYRLYQPVAAGNKRKHPICLLMEVAQLYGWPAPRFHLAVEGGPHHARFFCFSVSVFHMEFQPAYPSKSKRAAKADAAAYALSQLGVLPNCNYYQGVYY